MLLSTLKDSQTVLHLKAVRAADYPLTIGSNTFIPGFEDQLIGANTGDHVEVKVTFPEEYQAKELAGKEAVFQCDVKKIEAKELPELDDDFAKDVSEFDTLAEYKENVKKELTEKKEAEAKTAKENAVIDKVIENAQMDIPEAMIDTQCHQMMDDFGKKNAVPGPFHGAVLPVHRSEHGQDDGRYEATGS